MSSVADKIAEGLTPLGQLGLGLAIAAVPTAAALATYIARIAFQAKIDFLQSDRDRLKEQKEDQIAELQRKYTDLDEKYQTVIRIGVVIQGMLQAIGEEVAEIAVRLDAGDYSVLVPAPTSIPGDEPDQLVFLCASGDQAAQLKWIRVPIDASSMAGAVFQSGQARIAAPPASGTGFSARTDKVADYRTRETLSVCLQYRGKKVGVAQFLNKRDGRSFGSDDRERANTLCMPLSIRVADFLSDPRRLIELGHAPRQNQIEASVMFIDLSNSSALFGAVDSSVVVEMFNQYFAECCGIAVRHGAMIDQFIGDGALLLFNVSPQLDRHAAAAYAAAVEIKEAFGVLRRRWTTVGYAGSEGLFIRIGLEAGPVTRAELGYSNASRLTVIGKPVNTAAYACKGAPRDRDVIVMTAAFKARLGDLAKGKPLASDPKMALFEISD
jgi:class 3 adenylate cyclase